MIGLKAVGKVLAGDCQATQCESELSLIDQTHKCAVHLRDDRVLTFFPG